MRMDNAAPPQEAQPSYSPFNTLPDELIEHICFFLPLAPLSAVQSLNARFCRIAGVPLIWRQHCLNEYRYWHKDQNIRAKLSEPALATNWRRLLASRKEHEQTVIRRTFESALSTTVGRHTMLEKVVRCGYDARDYLLRQLEAPQNADDYLARTYWAKVALGQIERRMALREWVKLRNGESVSMERAVACVDLCVLDRSPMTLDETSEHLDQLAALFKTRHDAEYSEWTPRDRACHLGGFLKSMNLTGIENSDQWKDIRNNLISVALLEDDHNSLPLISAVIYCAVAQRLDLRASPINYPQRVHVVVSSSSDAINLDGKPRSTQEDALDYSNSTNYMFLDPSFNQPKSYDDLCHMLRVHQVPDAQLPVFMGPCSPRNMLIRISNNMAHSTEFELQNYSRILTHPTTNLDLRPTRDLPIRPAEVGWIVPAHILSLIRMIFNPDPAAYVAYLPRIVQAVVEDNVLDRGAVTEYLFPLLPDTPHGRERHANMTRLIEASYLDDTTPPDSKRRPSAISRGFNRPPTADVLNEPRWRVGDYFQHARYEYVGMITGWDTRCAAEEMWIQQMNVDSLPAGREQVFYHVVDENEGMRYVAEENIAIMGRHWTGWLPGQVVVPNENVVRVAGKWAKRWDPQQERFVSNMEAEYPDD